MHGNSGLKAFGSVDNGCNVRLVTSTLSLAPLLVGCPTGCSHGLCRTSSNPTKVVRITLNTIGSLGPHLLFAGLVQAGSLSKPTCRLMSRT